MTERKFTTLPFLLYRHERQVTADPPLHIDLDPKSFCPAPMIIESVEYMGNAYMRIKGHCTRHQEETYWIADYVNAE